MERKIFPNSDWNCGKAEAPDPADPPDPVAERDIASDVSLPVIFDWRNVWQVSQLLFTTTGPTSCTTSGVCVPGVSWRPAAPACFEPFVWANAVENAPEPPAP